MPRRRAASSRNRNALAVDVVRELADYGIRLGVTDP